MKYIIGILLSVFGLNAAAQSVVHAPTWKTVAIDDLVSIDLPIKPERRYRQNRGGIKAEAGQMGKLLNTILFSVEAMDDTAISTDIQAAEHRLKALGFSPTSLADTLNKLVYIGFIQGKVNKFGKELTYNIKRRGNDLFADILLFTPIASYPSLFSSSGLVNGVVITRERLLHYNNTLYIFRMVHLHTAEPSYMRELWDIMMASLDVKRAKMEATGTEAANH